MIYIFIKFTKITDIKTITEINVDLFIFIRSIHEFPIILLITINYNS